MAVYCTGCWNLPVEGTFEKGVGPCRSNKAALIFYATRLPENF